MFSGMTRGERWMLLGLIVAAGIGLAARDIRESRRQRVFELVEGRKPRELTRTVDAGKEGANSLPVVSWDGSRTLSGVSDRLNLNTATMAELMRLRGIGEVKARAIIEDRRVNGPFACVDDLDRVNGIGSATVEMLRPLVRVEGEITPGAGSVASEAGEISSAPPPAPPGTAPGPTPEFVPSVPSVPSPETAQVAPVQSPMAATPSSALSGKINLNRAGLNELMRLNGVGEVRARAIIEHRQRQGPFRRVEDLMKVQGIGVKTLEKNRASVTVD